MTAPRAAKYYVHTGEGTDALNIAKDSWANGGWQGLSLARLAFGKTPEEQQKINAGAQEIVDAANRGLERQWQPIGGAPKTGETILVSNDADICTVRWEKRGDGFWAINHGDCDEIDFAPTHWCALPQPPAA